MTSFGSVLFLLFLLLGCQKNIDNKEAIRQGVVEHLAKRTDLMALDVRVDAVQFRKNEADAVVYLQAKTGPATGNGMQMKYTLERTGNRWVVKDKKSPEAGGGPHGGGDGMQMPVPEPAPGASPALPPGHPPLPGSKK